jgi:hypothetical protein
MKIYILNFINNNKYYNIKIKKILKERIILNNSKNLYKLQSTKDFI